MLKSKLAKNGMITLPVEIRKALDINFGDIVAFVEDSGEYKLVPVKKMEDLIDPSHAEGTKRLIAQMRKDRANEP